MIASIKLVAQQVTIPWGMPTLNDLLQKTATHWQKRSSEKKKWHDIIAVQIIIARMRPTTGPVHVSFAFVPPHRRADPDNVSAVASKYILDELQHSQIIEQDNWAGIIGLHDTFKPPEKDNPHIVVTVRGQLK